MCPCCNGKDAEKLIAFAAGQLAEAVPGAAFMHLLHCPVCRQTLLASLTGTDEKFPAGELGRLRLLSDQLLTKFMRADAGQSWAKLTESVNRLAAALFADVMAAGRKERASESIFFRSLAANDHPDYWLAELLLPEAEQSCLQLRITDAAGRPVKAGTLILCNLALPVVNGACLVDLLEFQRNLHQKNISYDFGGGRVSPGVPLFFEDAGV